MAVRFSAPLLLLLAASCSQQLSPTSICQLPRNLAGWGGSEVRWQGLAIGTFHHGYSLIAKDCKRRGIALIRPDNEDGRALEVALRHEWPETGLVEIDVTGRIAGGALRISKVHRITLTPMSYEARQAYLRSLNL